MLRTFVCKESLTKTGLINRIYSQLEDQEKIEKKVTKKTISDMLDLSLNEIVEEVKNGNRVVFNDFGVFQLKSRKGFTFKSGLSQEEYIVPTKNYIKFNIKGKTITDINQPKDE
eukprot:TRINITY_DN14445_c0_g1_i1.p1 TRINITY_DN14445_c0_g1~~TRINITY_DN14445_c0_g1_i1.p1  ORF type:complete len:114 (-),score=25.65 TRINITY_DN14445_c0_g1_i1:13-354(-)